MHDKDNLATNEKRCVSRVRTYARITDRRDITSATADLLQRIILQTVCVPSGLSSNIPPDHQTEASSYTRIITTLDLQDMPRNRFESF